MAIKVNLFYPHLQQFTGGRDTVDVSGSSVGQCLDDLIRQYPALRRNIFDEQDQLFRFIAIFVNGQSTYKLSSPLAEPVGDGDEISIVLLLAGG